MTEIIKYHTHNKQNSPLMQAYHHHPNHHQIHFQPYQSSSQPCPRDHLVIHHHYHYPHQLMMSYTRQILRVVRVPCLLEQQQIRQPWQDSSSLWQLVGYEPIRHRYRLEMNQIQKRMNHLVLQVVGWSNSHHYHRPRRQCWGLQYHCFEGLICHIFI